MLRAVLRPATKAGQAIHSPPRFRYCARPFWNASRRSSADCLHPHDDGIERKSASREVSSDFRDRQNGVADLQRPAVSKRRNSNGATVTKRRNSSPPGFTKRGNSNAATVTK